MRDQSRSSDTWSLMLPCRHLQDESGRTPKCDEGDLFSVELGLQRYRNSQWSDTPTIALWYTTATPG
ncbi:hypothetical protein PHMEG_000767 [Phytophthora megakarya]|uniref:Uncharacterized protein n=1 Tax=Phytophthora megakarya TaxID=4795 RepID=A0A225X2V4_9STRA|nr:hypothetical protein PHMEG_000767 [Phytophthora megakarya]